MRKVATLFVGCVLAWAPFALAGPIVVDEQAYGQSLGGWDGKKEQMAEYEMAGNRYRSYRPDVTPTPDGGAYISVRIDHVRGFFASDDHASLEMTIDAKGRVVSTKSSISIQGKRVTSDLIAGGIRGAGQASTVSPAQSVVALGTDLVANLTEKLSRETKVEPGRVAFPAVVRHNLNLLFQAVHKLPDAPAPQPTVKEVLEEEEAPAEIEPAAAEAPTP